MLGGYNHKVIFVDEMESEGPGMSSGMNEFDDRVFQNNIHEGYVPAFLEDYDFNYDAGECDEKFEGMIFMSNRQTKKECFDRELFGLPNSQASVVKQVKPGMKLFLFEYERRQLYGVFEATSSGALNIERNAFRTSGGSFPAQVRIKTVWKCDPLSEEEFRDAIYKNYFTPKKFHFYLSQEQVLELIRLFSSKKIESQDMKGRDCFGSNHDLREKLDHQLQATMFLQEVRSNMSARESDIKNIEEDEILYTKDCYAGQGMRDVLDWQQRLALYSSEQPNFSTSFKQRLAIQSAQDDNVSCNCERRFALHSAQQCNHSGSCEQNVALHSAQQPNVSTGVQQINALHAVQQPIFSSSFEQVVAPHYLQQPNVSSSLDMSNSVFQPSYMRGYPSSEENYLVSGDAFTNGIKTSEEMDSTNGRDFYIPSNYRHCDSLHFNESGGPHVPLSLNSMPGIHAMPIDERPWFEHKELNQMPLNDSPANHNNVSIFSHMDIFQHDTPSQVMEQPERLVLRPKASTDAMSSLRSDNCTQKPSVFTRLKRVPQSDVSHDRNHRSHEDLLRHIHVAKSDVQQHPQKFLRSLGKKLEIAGGGHDSRLDIGVRDRQVVNDGVSTNHKQRSKVSNVGKELNMQVETHSKSVHNSLDIEDMEVTDEQTVNDGMLINFKRRSDTRKAVKESKSNDGESNSHRQKRRKLVRPEFNNPIMSQGNVLPVSVPESFVKSHVESKIFTRPENDPSTNSIVNGSVLPVSVPESVEKSHVESKIFTRPENDSSTNSIANGGVYVPASVEMCPVDSKILTQPESDPISNTIINGSAHVAESAEKCPVERKTLTQLENDAVSKDFVSRNVVGLLDSDCVSESEGNCSVESKNVTQPENDAGANTSVSRSVVGLLDSDRVSGSEGKCSVESKNMTQPENDASTNTSVSRSVVGLLDLGCVSGSEGKCPVESKNLTQPKNDASPNTIVTMICPNENKNLNQPETNVSPNNNVLPVVDLAVVDLVGSVSVPESAEEYLVENKALAQPDNEASTKTIASDSAACLVD